jgi:hypothetical protein
MSENKNLEADSKEMTVREASIFALKQSAEGLQKMKDDFKSVSNKFDLGNDAEGLQLIKDQVIPDINTLYQFGYTVSFMFDKVIGEELSNQLKEKVKALDEIMNQLCDETEKANFTEVGDILRFEFTDLINEFGNIFPKLVERFKACEAEELDQF